MIKFTGKTLVFVFMIILGIYFNMGILYLIPWPLNTINIVSVITVSWLYLRPSSIIIWYSIITYYCIDLITLSPFGILICSAAISSIALYWFFQYVFTRHSVISVFLLSIINIGLLRIGYIVLYYIYSNFVDVNPAYSSFLFSSITEMITTAGVCAVVYYFFIKKVTSPVKLISYVQK